METIHRIELFNKIFKDHVANRLNNVFWIEHFWEFLDNRGSLRDDCYGRLGIHLDASVASSNRLTNMYVTCI